MKLSSLTIVETKDYTKPSAVTEDYMKVTSGNAEFSNDKGITVKIILNKEDIEDISQLLRKKLKDLSGEL